MIYIQNTILDVIMAVKVKLFLNTFYFPPLLQPRTQSFPPPPNFSQTNKNPTNEFSFSPKFEPNQNPKQCVHGKSSPTLQTISTGKLPNKFPMLLPLLSPLPFPSLPWPIFFSKVPILNSIQHFQFSFSFSF